MYKKPYVIAEAGCNHKGEMKIAKDLIETAAHFCKADALKFRKDVLRSFLHRSSIICHICTPYSL